MNRMSEYAAPKKRERNAKKQLRVKVIPHNQQGRDMDGGGGIRAAWTTIAFPSSAGARDWASDLQGSEAPGPLDLAKKDTQKGI